MAGKGRRHEVAVDHGSRLAPDRRACAREIHKWASLRSVGRSQACRLGATSTSVRATRAALRHSLIGTTKQVSARTNHLRLAPISRLADHTPNADQSRNWTSGTSPKRF
jgi:hypothetical protein